MFNSLALVCNILYCSSCQNSDQTFVWTLLFNICHFAMFSCYPTVLSLSAIVPMTFQVPRFFLHLWSPIRVFACLVVVHIGEKVKRWGQGETPLFDISIETSVHSYFPVQHPKNSEEDTFCFFFLSFFLNTANVTYHFHACYHLWCSGSFQ